MPPSPKPRLRSAGHVLVAASVACLLASCGSGSTADEAEPAPSATSTGAAATASADPAAAEARRAAEMFLAALVAKEHRVAYGLLTKRAQAELSLEAFSTAREQKTASARSLGRVYRITGTSGTGDAITVTGEGLLADATDARIELAMVRTGTEWLVDRVPTAF